MFSSVPPSRSHPLVRCPATLTPSCFFSLSPFPLSGDVQPGHSVFLHQPHPLAIVRRSFLHLDMAFRLQAGMRRRTGLPRSAVGYAAALSRAPSYSFLLGNSTILRSGVIVFRPSVVGSGVFSFSTSSTGIEHQLCVFFKVWTSRLSRPASAVPPLLVQPSSGHACLHPHLQSVFA